MYTNNFININENCVFYKSFSLLLAAVCVKRQNQMNWLKAGADLGFSPVGAFFQKFFENFDDLFFDRSIRLIFRALPRQ